MIALVAAVRMPRCLVRAVAAAIILIAAFSPPAATPAQAGLWNTIKCCARVIADGFDPDVVYDTAEMILDHPTCVPLMVTPPMWALTGAITGQYLAADAYVQGAGHNMCQKIEDMSKQGLNAISSSEFQDILNALPADWKDQLSDISGDLTVVLQMLSCACYAADIGGPQIEKMIDDAVDCVGLGSDTKPVDCSTGSASPCIAINSDSQSACPQPSANQVICGQTTQIDGHWFQSPNTCMSCSSIPGGVSSAQCTWVAVSPYSNQQMPSLNDGTCSCGANFQPVCANGATPSPNYGCGAQGDNYLVRCDCPSPFVAHTNIKGEHVCECPGGKPFINGACGCPGALVPRTNGSGQQFCGCAGKGEGLVNGQCQACPSHCEITADGHFGSVGYIDPNNGECHPNAGIAVNSCQAGQKPDPKICSCVPACDNDSVILAGGDGTCQQCPPTEYPSYVDGTGKSSVGTCGQCAPGLVYYAPTSFMPGVGVGPSSDNWPGGNNAVGCRCPIGMCMKDGQCAQAAACPLDYQHVDPTDCTKCMDWCPDGQRFDGFGNPPSPAAGYQNGSGAPVLGSQNLEGGYSPVGGLPSFPICTACPAGQTTRDNKCVACSTGSTSYGDGICKNYCGDSARFVSLAPPAGEKKEGGHTTVQGNQVSIIPPHSCEPCASGKIDRNDPTKCLPPLGLAPIPRGPAGPPSGVILIQPDNPNPQLLTPGGSTAVPKGAAPPHGVMTPLRHSGPPPALRKPSRPPPKIRPVPRRCTTIRGETVCR